MPARYGRPRVTGPAPSPMLGEDIRRDWEKGLRKPPSQPGGERYPVSSQRNPRGLSRYVHRRHIQVIRLAAILLVTILSSVFITYMALKPDPAPVQEMCVSRDSDRSQSAGESDAQRWYRSKPFGGRVD